MFDFESFGLYDEFCWLKLFYQKKEPNVPTVQFLSKFEFGSNMGNTNVVDDRTKICSVT